MKVYDVPQELPWTQPDYRNFDFKAEQAREEKYEADLKQWLIGQGYTGKHTGNLVRFQIADGYAVYMIADAPRQSCLIHMPYGDCYHYPDVKYLPKSEIIKRVDALKALKEIFRKK
jgi:hypothetical protein